MKRHSTGLRALFLCAVLSISTTVAAAEQGAPDGPVLTAMLHAFLAGASINDAEVHGRFWSEDLVYTSSTGKRFGKADIMQGLQGASDEATAVYSAEDVRIQQFGDTAVVAFRLVARPIAGEDAPTEYFNTDTFVQQQGHWQVVAWQATRIPAETDD